MENENVKKYKKLISDYTLEDVKTGSNKRTSLQTIIDSDTNLTKDDRDEIQRHLIETIMSALKSGIKDLMIFGKSEDIDLVASKLKSLDDVKPEGDKRINLN